MAAIMVAGAFQFTDAIGQTIDLVCSGVFLEGSREEFAVQFDDNDNSHLVYIDNGNGIKVNYPGYQKLDSGDSIQREKPKISDGKIEWCWVIPSKRRRCIAIDRRSGEFRSQAWDDDVFEWNGQCIPRTKLKQDRKF